MTQNTLRRDNIVLRHICTGCMVCRGSMRPTWMWEGRAMQEQLPRWQGVTHVQDIRYGYMDADE